VVFVFDASMFDLSTFVRPDETVVLTSLKVGEMA